MSATQHTPGPWSLDAVKDYLGAYDSGIASGHPEALANAHLIAAAPELLEALKACEAALVNLRRNNRWDVHPEDLNDDVDKAVVAEEQARRVLAKAVVAIPTSKDTE